MKPVFVALLLAASAVAGATVQAQQVCDSSLYAFSSPTAHFEDHADGTVTDKKSRLMWMRCSVGQTWAAGRCNGEGAPGSWQSAQAVADAVNRGGAYFYDDWRLPNLAELATIAERQCSNPRVNLSVFPATAASLYWTATPQMGSGETPLVFALSFGAEGFQARPPIEMHYIRLVRNDL